ncbi:transposase [Saccharopolyspora pogona]|uniref:transposase n=1 Tax=Saccharopolyspora pogona TaxID=333966 RepID=UPI001CC258A2|nr:transposase [Saccharopolyspora pogona]
MDLEDAGAHAKYMIRDRDAKFPKLFDQILADAGMQIVLSGIRIRMNSIIERWVQTLRRELLDRTFIWNERHLHHALHEFEQHRNAHRPHQAMNRAAPLRAAPQRITDSDRIADLNIRPHDRLARIIQELSTCCLTCTDEVFGRRNVQAPKSRGR